MSRDNACVILDLIEAATDGNWHGTAEALKEMGYSPQEVERAAAWLAKLGGRSNPISAEDF